MSKFVNKVRGDTCGLRSTNNMTVRIVYIEVETTIISYLLQISRLFTCAENEAAILTTANDIPRKLTTFH